MATHHHLHVRKKFHEEMTLPEHSSDDTSQRYSLIPKNKPRRNFHRMSSSSLFEMECAGAAVGFFLALGLLLGLILLQHQHRKVIVHVIRDPWSHGGAIFRQRQGGFHHHFYTGSPRFVTVVLPSVVNPQGRSRRLQSIHETWGPNARAIFVLHNQTEEFPKGSHLTLSAQHTPNDPYRFPQSLIIPEHINPEHGVPRLMYTIRTIYEKVDPDFCFFVNDHTFVIPEHLCHFLDGRDPSEDLYAGHALRNGKSEVFNSGAAGYVLSRSTVRKLLQKWDSHDDSCWIGSEASSWLQGNPGLVTMHCLESLGIHSSDTRVDRKWHVFHAFPLTRMVMGNVDKWYHNKHEDMNTFEGFDESYSVLLTGEDCCAESTVSFHYVEYKECKALYETREALLKRPTMSDNELKQFMIQRWPSDSKDIGFYSKGLPTDDEAAFATIISVVRKISHPIASSVHMDC